ncbi:MAG: replicative DNA helicase [Lachnospiraceae bacterium]|nr:replicative DNA helicase [Lachnospiraceae bacterium]MCR4937268.1 replicative DNA helicase [Lachnospiraceae bacterium]
MPEQVQAKRLMPNDRYAEMAVIGGLFIDDSVIDMIKDDLPGGKYFYYRAYGSIYDAALSLHKRGLAVDIGTVRAELKNMGVPEEVASDENIFEAVNSVTSASKTDSYAKMIREKASLREMIKAAADIQDACYEGRGNVSEILTKAEASVKKVVEGGLADDGKSISDYLKEALSSIENAAKHAGEVTGLATGFTDLDRATAGFAPGNLVILAARPAMGKTALVLSMAKNISIDTGKPVAIFSLEMSGEEIVKRILSMDSNVESEKFKTGLLDDSDFISLAESSGNLARSGLYIKDTVFTLGGISATARRLKTEQDIKLVVVDYLQLVSVDSGRNASRENQISEISRGLKLLAKELGIPVIALSQLSREVEKRTDKKPQLADLRESGAIEQDADTVMFIYRDEVYNTDSDEKGIAQVIIAKQRTGPTGTVKLAWLPQYTVFKNLAHPVVR